MNIQLMSFYKYTYIHILFDIYRFSFKFIFKYTNYFTKKKYIIEFKLKNTRIFIISIKN